MLHSVIDAISRTVDEEEGIKSFEIESFADQNFLESWPLSQIVSKSMYCEYLKVAFLGGTTPNNRTRLLDFVGQMSVQSQNLRGLWIWFTHSTAKDGDSLLHTLLDSKIRTLEELTIFSEKAWFANGREKCLNMLLILLSRQDKIRKLYMCGNKLSD